jgi:hypothetical protein
MNGPDKNAFRRRVSHVACDTEHIHFVLLSLLLMSSDVSEVEFGRV